jgi:hypothetical protein
MTRDNSNLIIAKENNVFGKRMDLFSDSGAALGALIWATNPKPLNSRFGAQDPDETFTRLECEGQPYRIDFDNQHDRDGRKSGTRFLLRRLGADEILGEVRREFPAESLKRPQVLLVNPPQGAFVARWKWFRGYWSLLAPSGEELGYVCEPSALSFKRELNGILPGMTRAQQALCLYAFCFIKYMGSSAVPN